MTRPLRFIVMSADGRKLDEFTEDDLASATLAPEKTWQEALCWAYLAWRADGQADGPEGVRGAEKPLLGHDFGRTPFGARDLRVHRA